MDETSEEDRGSHKKRNSCSTWFAHFLASCCCAGFLNPNGEGSKEYYATLGVSRHAKLAEIKKSYKKLSLSYHPDKLRQRGEVLTEEMQEKFRKIKQAYEVLSDPERRKIYDSFGINGIMLKEDPTSFLQNPAKVQELINKADTRAWCVVLTITTLILGFIFLFPILFALEVDGDIDVSFTAIFTPLWLVYLIMFIVITFEVARGKSVRPEDLPEDEEWFDDHPLVERQIGLLAFLLFVLFQIMIVSKLDGGFDSDDSWVMIMLPYYLFEIAEMVSEWMAMQTALRYAGHCENMANQKETTAEDDDIDVMGLGMELRMKAEESNGEARLHVSSIIYHNYRLIQVFVVVVRVDGYLGNANWWLVLIPTMIYAFVNCGEFGRNRYKAGLKSQELDEMMAAPPPENFKEHSEQELLKAKASAKKEFLLSFGAQQCCTGTCILLYLLLLGFYLTKDDDDRFSFFWFYFPFAVLLFFPLCCLCCMSLCGFEDGDDDEVEEVDVSDINPEDLEAALLQSGMLDGDGNVDPEVMKALVESLKNTNDNNGNDTMNPVSTHHEIDMKYKCPDCNEIFDEWDLCLVHFATTNHGNYNDEEFSNSSDQMSKLKDLCMFKDESVSTTHVVNDTSKSDMTIQMSQSSDNEASMEPQVVVANIEDDANIDDID